MDGASYGQAAARHGVSTSVAWKWSQGFRHIAAKPGGDGRSRLKGARGWLLRRVAETPDLTLGQLQRGASRPRYLGRPHGAAEISQEVDHRDGK